MTNRLIPPRAVCGAALLAMLSAACTQSASEAQPAAPPGSYLYVWAGDGDEKDSDFLAVVDALPGSATYGELVATLPVGAAATMPHHVEYESPRDNLLFANGWKAGHSFIIDLKDPLKPRLAGQFKGAGGYSFPHSFARLPNGRVLSVFQSAGKKYAPPGGLVELDLQGKAVRATPSHSADIPDELNWPYSLAVHPTADRVITTSTDMGMPPFEDWPPHYTNHVQIWSLSKLTLLHSVALPPAPDGGRRHIWPAEPRVLADGSVYVNSFNCGLYRLTGIDGATPKAEWVHSFPGGTSMMDMCAVPVVSGKYWVQTVAGLPGLIVLDVSNPAKPVEVSRLDLGKDFPMPHWLAADRASDRLILTGDGNSWALMLRLNPKTGKLTIDERFRDRATNRVGARFDRASWPHGASGKAIVHGAVFRG